MSADVNSPDDKSYLPKSLFWVVVAVCAAPFLLAQLGVDFSTYQRPLEGPESFNLPDSVLEHAVLRTVAGSFTHTILQWTAVTTAILTALLALLHFSIKRDAVTPVIGIALLCAGLMDGFHTLAADRLIIPLLDHRDFIPLTWSICRLFSALILIVGACAILVRKADAWEGSAVLVVMVSVVFGGFAIVLSVFSYNMAQVNLSGAVFSRPYDVPPLILFLLAGGFVLPALLRGVPNLFTYALLLSVIPQIAAQVAMLFGSDALHDGYFNIALFLKCVAYFVPFVGLMLDYVQTYRALDWHVADRIRVENELQAKQDALHVSEEQYRDLFENANDLIQCVAPNGSFLYVNRVWRETLGYTSDEVSRLSLFDVLYPDSIIGSDSKQFQLDFFQRVMRGEDLENYEVSLLTKDGRRVIVEGTTNTKWVCDRPVASRGIFRDITEKKRIESERDRLFSVSLDMLGIAGLDGRFRRVNPAFQRRFGFHASEYLARPLVDFVHPDDQQATQQALQQLTDGFDVDGLENRCLCQDGTYRWISWTCPAPHSGENLLYLVGHDVTLRRQTEEAQRASEEQFRTLVEHAPEAMVVYDADQQLFASFNGRALDLFGMSGDTLSSSGPAAISPLEQPSGESSDEVFRRYVELALEGEAPSFEWMCQKTTGADIPCEVRMVRLPAVGRRLVRASIADITQRKEAEKAARLQSAIVESTDDAVIGKSLDGSIVTWNAGAQRIFGYALDDVLGKPISILVPKERLDEELGLLAKIQKGERIEHYETIRTRQDGAQIDVSLAISPICDDSGRVIGASTIARDISQRKLAERELEQAKKAAEETSRAKSQFLANMSHEIRTPMNGVLGMTELALNTQMTDEQREYLQTVKQSADSLLTIINDILDFSKIEAGRMELDLTVFSLRNWLDEVLRPFSVRAREKGLSLDCRVEWDVPDLVVGDVGRLRQVVVNLIGNAIKFTDTGKIRVDIDKYWYDHHDVVLHFSVTDTGIGIPADKQETIFEAFTQADTSTTRNYGGTGLGLSICAQLVGLMGGKIWINSRAGHGSTFHFTAWLSVPKEKEEASALEPTLPSPALSNGNGHSTSETVSPLNVLVAEDNQVNQELARRLLLKSGHQAHVVSNGHEALEALESHRFDVVLMDIQMPRMDGFEATAKIREQQYPTGQRVPIVAMTAHAMQGDRQRCLQAGMDDYLSKPVDPQALAAVLRKVATQQAGLANNASSSPKPDGRLRFDLDAAVARVDGDMGLLRELAELFLKECPKMVSQVQEAIARRNGEDLEMAAHKLRGALANFFSLGDIEPARRLEEMGRESRLNHVEPVFEELVAEIGQLREALESLVAPGTPQDAS